MLLGDNVKPDLEGFLFIAPRGWRRNSAAGATSPLHSTSKILQFFTPSSEIDGLFLLHPSATENPMRDTDCNKFHPPPSDEVESSAVIDSQSYHLIHQALIEALSLGVDYEVEQMVRAKNVPAVRQRVQVQFGYDGHDRISALRATFERDGEVVCCWLIQSQNEIQQLIYNIEGRGADELADLFTVICINAHTAKRYVKLEKVRETQAVIDKMIPKLNDFWLRSQDYIRRRNIVKLLMGASQAPTTPYKQR